METPWLSFGERPGKDKYLPKGHLQAVNLKAAGMAVSLARPEAVLGPLGAEQPLGVSKPKNEQTWSV